MFNSLKELHEDKKGQLSIEGIIAVVLLALMTLIAIILYIYMEAPLAPFLNNAPAGNGVIALNLIRLLIFVIMPFLTIISAVMLIRPPVQQQFQ